MRFKYSFIFVFFFYIVFSCTDLCKNENKNLRHINIEYNDNAIIEIGSPYTGIEFHHSLPVPQRISFYYPVANSLDQSTDYWTRDSSFTLAISVEQGGKKEWLNNHSFTFNHTPYSINFSKEYDKKKISIGYKFTKDFAAVIIDFKLKNISKVSQEYNIETFSNLSIRTSHSYNRIIDCDKTTLNSQGDLLLSYPFLETDSAKLFYLNLGEVPKKYSAGIISDDDIEHKNEWWKKSDIFESKNFNKRSIPSANYLYNSNLKPDEEINIIQIIGMSSSKQAENTIEYMRKNYKTENEKLVSSITSKINCQENIHVGDSILDHSVLWAKSIIEVNRHYIDGYFPIMPCPAEYNFYFTHDLLLTNLAIVKYDPDQTKKDLEFIISHADRENIIPHAYYWKDTGFVTELSSFDNWNNFWFVILSSSYLKHSGDVEFLNKLFPFIDKSISLILENEIKNGLVYSYRPDWWDAGRNYGARSYMTILANKSIRDFIYILEKLNKKNNKINQLRQIADDLRNNLNNKLWSNEHNYLMNILEDGSIDEHYYMGSLLAVHYNLLDRDKTEKLVRGGEKYLLDKNIGIRNVVPTDFHLVSEKYGLKNGEEGKVGVYFNGGVWPHANAFYALSLIELNKKKQAFDFIKRLMTPKGIMRTPNGQPAMFEYRNSNHEDPEKYGKIDKPSFTWAGGWYLYVLYTLLGAQEDDFNLHFSPYVNEELNECEFTYYAYGKKFNVMFQGDGNYVESIEYGGQIFPTLIIPENAPDAKNIMIKLGDPKIPYLEKCTAHLLSAEWDYNSKTLIFEFESKELLNIEMSLISPLRLKRVIIDNNQGRWKENVLTDNMIHSKINYIPKSTKSIVQLEY